MSDARLPINHWDTGKVSRDKINDSFNDLVTTVAWYRPHIESWIRWIWTTNTWVQAKWDNVEMKVDDGCIRYKSSSVNNWTSIIAIADLKGDKWDAATVTVGTVTTWAPWSCVCVTNSGTCNDAILNFSIPQGAKWDTWSAATVTVWTTCTGAPWSSACVTNTGTCCAAVLDFTIPQWATGATWNGIACITSSKAWKVTTVDITCTNGCSYCFNVCDGEDGQGAWDVVWPNSACDGNLAVFDGTTWKLIKDWGVIPSPTTVVDNLTSQSTTSALSANQWYILNGKINDLMAQGKFLSLWDSTTGLPISFPLITPYVYNTWDYFMVETIDTWDTPTNYRPAGSSYSGTASSTTESEEVAVWDYYVYDWSIWLLATNHGKSVSFANLAWDAMDNANLSGYLNTKAFYLPWTTWSANLAIAQAAYQWQNGGKTAIIIYSNKPYTFLQGNAAWMSFKCLYPYEFTDNSTGKTDLYQDALTFSLSDGAVTSISAGAHYNLVTWIIKASYNYTTAYTPQYDWSPATKKYVDGKVTVSSTTPTNPTEGMIWYDTANDVLKTYDGSNWNESGGGWFFDGTPYTQAEYNDLPASKDTDWIWRLIYE